MIEKKINKIGERQYVVLIMAMSSGNSHERNPKSHS